MGERVGGATLDGIGAWRGGGRCRGSGRRIAARVAAQPQGRDEASGLSGSLATSRLSRRGRPGFTSRLTTDPEFPVRGKHSPFDHHVSTSSALSSSVRLRVSPTLPPFFFFLSSPSLA